MAEDISDKCFKKSQNLGVHIRVFSLFFRNTRHNFTDLCIYYSFPSRYD